MKGELAEQRWRGESSVNAVARVDLGVGSDVLLGLGGGAHI